MFNGIKGMFLKEKKALNVKNSRFGLTNFSEGSGTGRAIDSYNDRAPVPYLTYRQLDELFRSNWMARKIVETPASDMTRKWREFYHEDGEILAKRLIVEKKLCVKDEVRKAIQWADLYGGSAIVLGLDDDDASQPLNLKNIRKGDLSYIDVVFKDQITPVSPTGLDPYCENYQNPEYYFISGSSKTNIHSSRIIKFYGAELPLYAMLRQNSWGDSRLTSAIAVLEIAEKTWLNISQLISQANVDVIQMDGYLDMLNRVPEEVYAALNYQANITSNYKKLIIDTKDKYDRKELSGITGLSEVLMQFLQMVAGSAGMPLTKFLGTSVGGFSVGNNEITEYYDSIAERQNRISKQLNYLDKIIELSTFGEYLAIDYEWKSLIEMNENEKTDIDLKRAQRDEINLRIGVVDESMIAQQLQADGTYNAITSEWVEALKDMPSVRLDESDIEDEEAADK